MGGKQARGFFTGAMISILLTGTGQRVCTEVSVQIRPLLNFAQGSLSLLITTKRHTQKKEQKRKKDLFICGVPMQNSASAGNVSQGGGKEFNIIFLEAGSVSVRD